MLIGTIPKKFIEKRFSYSFPELIRTVFIDAPAVVMHYQRFLLLRQLLRLTFQNAYNIKNPDIKVLYDFQIIMQINLLSEKT